jgi:uncharacterized protein (DUF305 family)
MRTRPTLRLAASAAALTLALAACGDDESPDPDADGDVAEAPETDVEDADGEDADEAPDAAGEANDADVEFVRGMIPHHEGAIEMAELVPERTERPELLDIADEIIEVQDAEIDMLRAMLDRMGADAEPTEGTKDMDGGSMDEDEMGMMTDEEMADLEAAQGEEFERLFLHHMIEHHEGAIHMAERVLEDGQDAEVAALAEMVIETQEAEIEQMREWQEEWGL